ncbi:tRNA (adenosine(37)-N6)-dimethylallyltransferase MiaA [Piscinibacter terrae]|uniref:tRNA dimethylallyltransferase n=1 Tax=Piscinibacter terrae TaxID=2496871 RepID=A0A3N7HUD2_9BURK|nr:tRNA (adenosine(37)-N6)-dimethylallyltransferase MiaA [Albitalea terrae]RQP25874.1 tRNA (adenosine(37)-N6)-dimethylallyltransferase MiaA [Albitalea terrae]
MKPLLCVAGPTASGKTAAALALAEAFARVLPVEIVSVDSALVYRGMDIGTAKPTAAEQARVPHHLIDIIEPSQAYSAAQFVADANRLVEQIQSRGHLPLLVGGTMMYFKALFEGLDEMPASEPAVRAALDEEASRLGWPAMHAALREVDPITAARLKPGDSQRIQRALEVLRISGRPLSSFHSEKAPRDAPPLISLEPESRAWLHERIAQRFDAMLDHGFIDEVKRLRARGDLTPELPSMRCVGYRQAWEALDDGDLSTLRDKGIAATRQLAKRQLTWLRSMPQRQVVACDLPGAVDAVLARAHELLQPLLHSSSHHA